MGSMVDDSKAQHTTSRVNAAPARPIPCFFLGTPYVRDPHACKEFGGVRLVMWETYCNPDPSCMKNPDGTSFLTP